MNAEAEYWQHPAFERVVDLLTLTTCDHCSPPLGEIAAHIIHDIERPGTPIAPLSEAARGTATKEET